MIRNSRNQQGVKGLVNWLLESGYFPLSLFIVICSSVSYNMMVLYKLCLVCFGMVSLFRLLQVCNQSISQSFNAMFHASTGQTLTRTSQRHDSRSAAFDGSKFNLLNHQHTANKWQTEKNLRPDALPVGGYYTIIFLTAICQKQDQIRMNI